MITVGSEGSRWVWHRKVPGITWTSRESFATLPEAITVGKSVANCKGDEFMMPQHLDIWVAAEPEEYELPPAPEPPIDYTAEVDAEAVAQFLHSLELAGFTV